MGIHGSPAPEPLKTLLVKSEYLVQSVIKYPLTPPCPHCSSKEQTLVARKYGVARIMRCNDCGLYFSRPIYRSWVTDNLYDGLYAAGFATSLPGEVQLQKWIDTDFREIGRDAGPVLAALREHVSDPRPALLEFGCSWGYFLYQARAKGFAVTGVEVGASRRAYGRDRLGLRIVAGVDDLEPGERFDIIYTAHVLEHLTDLRQILGQMAARLNPGGVCFVEVPNFDPRQFGSECFPAIGAVHPLGFDSEFFRVNLPRHDLVLTGVFESWEDVPHRPVNASHSNRLVIRAAHEGAARP